MKKMARPRQEPWLTPRTRTQNGAEPSGAHSDPASPAAVPIRLGTTRPRWLGRRWASTGTMSEVARLPTPISASRLPAVTAESPRSWKMVGSQDSAA
jgi:hypothetical protein